MELVSFHPLHGQRVFPLGCSEPCPTWNSYRDGVEAVWVQSGEIQTHNLPLHPERVNLSFLPQKTL